MNRPAFQEDLTAIGWPNTRYCFDQRRFARAIVTNQANNLARVDLKIYIRQRAHCSKGLVDPLQAQAWFAHVRLLHLSSLRSDIIGHRALQQRVCSNTQL